jgi:predicted house-cleaning noncanonical NTP pyrophosphatase (MazG superfamily)
VAISTELLIALNGFLWRVGIDCAMKEVYQKLVRDKIPEIILKSGNNCKINHLSESEYLQALKLKLIEESEEVAHANSEDLLKELADLYEVIDCLLAALKITEEMVTKEQDKRREERGSFLKKVQLVSTEIRG